jgi:hypothetical protein
MCAIRKILWFRNSTGVGWVVLCGKGGISAMRSLGRLLVHRARIVHIALWSVEMDSACHW